MLQPYGSLFFAAAPVFEAALPALTDASRNSVVILRLRGRSDLGTTFMDVLYRYAQGLAALGSKLVIVSANQRIQEQLAVTGITDLIGAENLYTGDERVGATVKRAHADAMAWIETNRRVGRSDADWKRLVRHVPGHRSGPAEGPARDRRWRMLGCVVEAASRRTSCTTIPTQGARSQDHRTSCTRLPGQVAQGSGRSRLAAHITAINTTVRLTMARSR